MPSDCNGRSSSSTFLTTSWLPIFVSAEPSQTISLIAGLSTNILHAGDKSLVQSSFYKNGTGDLLPALRSLGRLYNFCNFGLTSVRQHPVKSLLFSLMQVTMICRRATYYTGLGMIKYYQKTCSWNSKSTKTKKYIKNYSRYTALKNNSFVLCSDVWHCYKNIEISDLQLAY